MLRAQDRDWVLKGWVARGMGCRGMRGVGTGVRTRMAVREDNAAAHGLQSCYTDSGCTRTTHLRCPSTVGAVGPF